MAVGQTRLMCGEEWENWLEITRPTTPIRPCNVVDGVQCAADARSSVLKSRRDTFLQLNSGRKAIESSFLSCVAARLVRLRFGNDPRDTRTFFFLCRCVSFLPSSSSSLSLQDNESMQGPSTTSHAPVSILLSTEHLRQPDCRSMHEHSAHR